MFGVSRQVYYRAKRSKIKRKIIAQQVIDLVNNIRVLMPRIGTKKLYYMLKAELIKLGVGRDRLFSILRANQMLIKPRRQYHITTNSFHRFQKHKNLTESMEITRPEQVWVSDITYIGNRKNPMYLSIVTDAYSKKIMGYYVANNLNTNSSVKALKMALKNRKYKNKALIHHSDRGIQYASNQYQEVLNKQKVNCSMTESYDPYQNAIAERINGIIKYEFINDVKVNDINIMRKLIENSVDIYNNIRPHYSCYMYTPNQMHQQSEIKIRTYKNKYSRNNKTSAV